MTYHVMFEYSPKDRELKWSYSKMSRACTAARNYQAPGRTVVVVDSTNQELLRIS